LISTYISDFSTWGITIQEKKSAQGLLCWYLMKACRKDDAQAVANKPQEEMTADEKLKVKY
jgi:hypothetical protein